MRATEREALESLSFDWAQVPDDVWRPSPFHVDELHEEVVSSIAGGVRTAAASPDGSPVGVAIQGQRGAGKTHLLGMVRQEVQRRDGYFFLVSLHDGSQFWESVVLSVLEGLWRETDRGARQLTEFLRRLAARAGVLGGVTAAVTGAAPLTSRAVASLVAALRRLDRHVGIECQDTLRALVLSGAEDFQLQDIGYQFLQSQDEAEPGERSGWSFRGGTKPPRLVVRDISRLLALTGPSVIAVDQIDGLLAESVHGPTDSHAPVDGDDGLLLDQIASGLMSLREVTRRTLTVVACLPESWILIKDRAVNTVPDRFREELQLHRIPDARVGRELVEKRFTARFAEIGFKPPYPTWPVSPDAFADAMEFTPRSLLQRVDSHIRACLRGDAVHELTQLSGDTAPADTAPADAAQAPVAERDLGPLDARFAQLRASAEVAGAWDHRHEDVLMSALLSAALTAWIAEQDAASGQFSCDPPPGSKPALHARLRRSLDEHTEAEQHWSFRAIASSNALAVQARLRNACTMAGLRQGRGTRHLFVLRGADWPRGPKTREVVGEFVDAGGVALAVQEDDLRTFAALRQLLAERDGSLHAWLVARQPASGTALLRAALGQATGQERVPDVAPEGATEPERERLPERPNAVAATGDGWRDRPRVVRPRHPADEPERADEIVVGHRADTGAPVRLPLEGLRKHTAIFAGSGSGKTVLIRRMVEECARHGVSTIVLDPNNDLARLGDGWPEEPSGWGPGDAERAADYLAGTDVVVWTPGREAGRPLTFQPLPDFAGVRDDPDEFRMAVEAAVAALAPRAKVDGTTSKAQQGQAVLRQAMSHFGRGGGGDLRGFISLLDELPDGVSELDKAEKIAFDMAQNLTAAMVIDPLFGGSGTPADPGRLLTPPRGKRARVSVISLVGLPGDEQRQSFVNQLQLALFAWVKQHPAGDRPLGGLLVMDEAQVFGPSGAMTASTESTVALASQARKFGLGLVFATQAPKALHNRVAGNAANQFFGFLNSQTQIEAAREMARAKGSAVLDISRLGTGEFYVAGEGAAFTKVRSPLCLSHHPRSPLTAEEVVERARGSDHAAVA